MCSRTYLVFSDSFFLDLTSDCFRVIALLCTALFLQLLRKLPENRTHYLLRDSETLCCLKFHTLGAFWKIDPLCVRKLLKLSLTILFTNFTRLMKKTWQEKTRDMPQVFLHRTEKSIKLNLLWIAPKL